MYLKNSCIFTSVKNKNKDKMKTTKLRKGEYQVTKNDITYIIMRNHHEDGNSWYVYDNEGDFLFSHKTKSKCLKLLNVM